MYAEDADVTSGCAAATEGDGDVGVAVPDVDVIIVAVAAAVFSVVLAADVMLPYGMSIWFEYVFEVASYICAYSGLFPLSDRTLSVSP